MLPAFVFLFAYVGFSRFLAVPVHECGHLLAGLASGYRFGFLRLFGRIWYLNEKGRLLSRPGKLAGVNGQCLMIPPKEESQFHFVLYMLGGALANLVVGTASLLPLMTELTTVADAAGALLLASAITNFYVALFNLIPMNFNLPNDGMNIWMASRSPAARHGFYLAMQIAEETRHGKRFRDFDPDLFALPGNADAGSYYSGGQIPGVA